MALIEIRELTKTYHTPAGPLPVLHGLNLDIEQGDYAAIMGPSGSGKSTFMNLLGCLDSPSGGRYHFDAQDVAALPPTALASIRNRRIGFVFQSFNLLPRMSIVDNVGLPLVYGGMGRSERRRRAAAMLEHMGLSRHLQALPSQISGGQQQRVAIARALVNQPQLVLADEPTGNLDSETSAEIMALFNQLNDEGVTLVLVTHEADIARHARRQIRFRDGQIVNDTGARA